MPALSDLPISAPAAPQDPVPASPEAPAAPEALPTPFDQIVAGTLPGVQIPPLQRGTPPSPVQQFVVENFETLLAAGLDHTDLPDDTTVLFNPSVLDAKKISAAFDSGTLDQLAPKPGSPAPGTAPEDPAALAGVPMPGAGPAPGPAGSTPPGVGRTRLANVTPPAPIRPNPIPDQLARRAL